MKIAASDVKTTSSHTSISYESRSVSATVTAPNTKQTDPADSVDLTQQSNDPAATDKDAAKEAADNLKDIYSKTAQALKAKKAAIKPVSFAKDLDELKIKMIDLLLSAISGRRMKFRRFDPEQKNETVPQPDNLQHMSLPQSEHRDGLRAELNMTHTSYEYESVSYSAQAQVQTADGKSISIDIGFSMSREVSSFTSVSMGWNGLDNAGKRLCDPLVINYGGTAMSLTDQKFDFDLDFDGNMDKISFAGEGSGFLALDKNGDGTINDGSELFGPTDGDGFSELRGYDSDGNGWIDENDDIYLNLRVWSKDADGNDQLFTLKELDVGAIYLGDISTEYSLNDGNNVNQGVMRSTSFFLKDSGGAGFVSHVDLSI